MIWIIAILATGLLAYGLACRFAAVNFLAAAWDEWRLRHTSLAALDRTARANPRSSGLVVSLTTIPSRIDALAPTLKSLLRQTARPAWSRREQRAYVVPEWLRALRSVTLVACDDEGPATKFLPTLRAAPADQPVGVLDDERIYHARLLERFAALGRTHPDEVVSAAGWRAPADFIDRPTTLWTRLTGAPCVPIRANQLRRPRRVDVVQGLHGYVVRPRFFDLAALGDFAGAPAAARFVDDVWLSAHCRVPRVVHPLRLAFTDYKPWEHRRRYDATSLGRNVNRAANPAQRGNSILLRFFSDRWRG